MKYFLQKLQDRIDSYKERQGELTPRSTIFKLLFWSMRELFKKKSSRSTFTDHQFHILIIPLGGIGDFAFAAKYIHCLKETFGENILIDISVNAQFEREVAEAFFSNSSHIHQICQSDGQPSYDCGIAICRYPMIRYLDKERLHNVGSVALKHYIETVSDFMIKNIQLYESDYLGRCYSQLQGYTQENQADINHLLGMSQKDRFFISPPENYQEILAEFGVEEDQFIVIQSGPGKHFMGQGDTRQCSMESLKKVINDIKSVYPDMPVLQVGQDYQKPIPNTDMNLLGKTNFKQLLALLKGARLLISQEGGMPIVRHFVSRKPSCVIFGSTDPHFYGFKENINLSANRCAGCEWVTDDWYQQCMITKEKTCMNIVSSDEISQSILTELG